MTTPRTETMTAASDGLRPLSIDVYALARSAVASMRPNLVTRPTGRAVRAAIEERLAGSRSAAGWPGARHHRREHAVDERCAGSRPALVSLLDLRGIRVLDFSCADEVVAKLVLRYLGPDRPGNVFFLFRAVEDLHRHAVEEVLHRHRLAAVCDVGDQRFELLGDVGQAERGVWTTLERRGCIDPGAGAGLGREEARVLQGLADRRLAYVGGGGEFWALSAATRPAQGGDR